MAEIKPGDWRLVEHRSVTYTVENGLGEVVLDPGLDPALRLPKRFVSLDEAQAATLEQAREDWVVEAHVWARG